MLFQDVERLFIFVLWLVLATIIVALIIFIVVILLESKTKAADKKFMIIILAFLIVLVLPIVVNAITAVLAAIGGALAAIRDTPNYLLLLGPVIGFLLLLLLTKYLIDIPWDKAVWISLLILFLLYILFTIIPELYTFIYEYQYDFATT